MRMMNMSVADRSGTAADDRWNVIDAACSSSTRQPVGTVYESWPGASGRANGSNRKLEYVPGGSSSPGRGGRSDRTQSPASAFSLAGHASVPMDVSVRPVSSPARAQGYPPPAPSAPSRDSPVAVATSRSSPSATTADLDDSAPGTGPYSSGSLVRRRKPGGLDSRLLSGIPRSHARRRTSGISRLAEAAGLELGSLTTLEGRPRIAAPTTPSNATATIAAAQPALVARGATAAEAGRRSRVPLGWRAIAP